MENSKFFSEIHGNFGFGCMRLPMNGNKVDYGEFTKMADAFIAAGFNYFDTAHGYVGGLSETAIGDCVSARYDRDKFILTNKLTEPYFNKQEDIRPLFQQQLGQNRKPQPQQQAYAAYQQNSVNAERANWPIKNKIVAAILALILGGLGVHKFYLGQTGKGVLYLIFCWTYIPSILAFIEGIMILCSNDENFQIKYKCRIG